MIRERCNDFERNTQRRGGGEREGEGEWELEKEREDRARERARETQRNPCFSSSDDFAKINRRALQKQQNAIIGFGPRFLTQPSVTPAGSACARKSAASSSLRVSPNFRIKTFKSVAVTKFDPFGRVNFQTWTRTPSTNHLQQSWSALASDNTTFNCYVEIYRDDCMTSPRFETFFKASCFPHNLTYDLTGRSRAVARWSPFLRKINILK